MSENDSKSQPPKDLMAVVQDKVTGVVNSTTAKASETVDQYSKTGVTGMLETVKNIPTYFTGGDFQKFVEDFRVSRMDYFHQFEKAAGIVMPDDVNHEADVLREQIKTAQEKYEAKFEAAKKQADDKRVQLAAMVKSYEEAATKMVADHEDALQFKYLSADITKEAMKQRQIVEELMEDEMKQYSFQAKDCAAQIAMVASMTHKMMNGDPFETELTGLLSFQKMSKLANNSRGNLLEATMLHEDIKACGAQGTPSKSTLFQTFEELYPKVQAMKWVLPDAGLPGRVWKSVSSSLASDADDLNVIRGYLTQGDVKAARHGMQRWMAANMTLKRDLPSDVPKQLRQFSKDCDTHLRCAELSRYLRAKTLAQQKGLLQ